jgi:hypothetical protein
MQSPTSANANHRNNRHAVYGLALIGLGVLVHYGWAWFPAEHQAQAWNALGAFARLLGWIGAALWIRHGAAYLVAFWLCCEELMVIGCSVAYIVSPWEVLPGQAQCSALLQFDLGRIGICAAVLLLIATVRVCSIADNARGG